MRIGIDAIKQMALKLGLNQKYMDDILAHEMPGIIPDRHWKEKNTGVPWVHGDTIISGIGQGFILTNCLQLAVMMARVASNKIVVPHLMFDDKKYIKSKFRESVNQLLGNVLVPIGCVWGISELYKNNKTKIINLVPQIQETGKKSQIFNKALRCIPGSMR